MVTTTEGRESPRVAHRFLVPRLSLMMFMQFFIWGSWSVTLGLVMTRYEMSLLIGDAFSAGPIASILSPFVLGMLVDRFFASQKVMAVMHLAGAVILWFVPQALVAQNGALLIGLLFGYTLCYMPTLALTNNIAFHSLANVDKTFPVVRVFGTIGWIIAGIFIGVTGISDTTGIFTLAALCSAALAVYSLTLPHTPAPAKGTPVQFRDLLCADAFALLKTRHFLLYLGILLHGVCYDFFFVVGFIYTDRVAGEKVKGQAQSMIVMFTYGIGMLLGSQISGALYNHLVAGQSVPQAWVTFWWIPAVAAAVIALIFLFSFQYNEKEQR